MDLLELFNERNLYCQHLGVWVTDLGMGGPVANLGEAHTRFRKIYEEEGLEAAIEKEFTDISREIKGLDE